MKRELKKTFTYTTKPSIKEKAERRANREGVTLSEKINDFLNDYVAGDVGMSYFDNVASFVMKESNKKKK